jgi:chitinase
VADGSIIIGGVQYDVTLLKHVPDPPKPLPSGRTLAVYLMMWSNSGSPKLSTLPRQITEVRLAFAQGDPPILVGWASQSQTDFLADVAALKARGVRFVVAVGGQGGMLNTRSRDAFIGGIARIHSIVGLDGLDWDLEASTLISADVVAISQALHDRYGWKVSFAPNGGNVDRYLPTAVTCQAAGILSTYGQQFYDAPVTLGAAMSRVDQAVAAGIAPSRITVGCMVGPDASHWTVDQCATNVGGIRAKYSDLAGAYLWEAGRAGTTDWATRIGALLT